MSRVYTNQCYTKMDTLLPQNVIHQHVRV